MTPTADNLVLVTGASGFVGRALVPGLAANGWRVRAATRDAAAMPSRRGVEPVIMPDLSSPVDWGRLLSGVTHIVHLAGIAHTGSRLPEATYMRVNAEASVELARAAKAAGVARLVLMSSIRAQTGAAAAGTVTVESPPAPTDAYGRSKLAAERAIAAELGPAACSLRPVLVMGPGVKGNLAALARLARSPLPLPLGALRNRRSLLGLTNLGSVVQFALMNDAARGATFLAADPEPLTVAELIAAMRRALGREPNLVAVPPPLLARALTWTGRAALAASLLGELVASNAPITNAGWRPSLTSEEEIARMMAARVGVGGE